MLVVAKDELASSGSSGLTTAVADWVVGVRARDLPERALRLATDAITDCIGVALAGTRQELAPKLLSVLETRPLVRGAQLFGSDRESDPATAALYNGTVAHALDYDDINHPAYSHPSAHLVPTLFALAAGRAVSGMDVITAYVVGFELEGKLGRALNVGIGIPHLKGHYARGWHTTGTFGSLASALGGAHLLRLDAEGVRIALGVAGTSASGLRASFGTMSKPLNAGLAARNGVLATLLARARFTAAEDILDDRFGFLAVMSDGAWNEGPLRHLGLPWEITTDYGLAIKAYPACGATHPAIEAALELHTEIGGDAIDSITVGVNEVMPSVLVYPNPKTPLEGKFSMEFCVAAALSRGIVNIATFRDDVIADPAVRGLMARMEVRTDERVRFNPEHGAAVAVTCRSGRKLERLVNVAKGKPERWLTSSELRDKFLDCIQGVLTHKRAHELFTALQALPNLATMEPILEKLR